MLSSHTGKIRFIAEVVAAVIFDECMKVEALKGELIVRGYNVAAEKNYVYAHTKMDAAKILAQKAK